MARDEALPQHALAHQWLRPGDLADLPAASVKYLTRMNHRLHALARAASKLKYKRTVSQLLKKSASLDAFSVLRQLVKDGSPGFSGSLSKYDRERLRALLYPKSGRMPPRLRKAI